MFYLKTIVSDTVPQIAEEEMKMFKKDNKTKTT